MGTKEFRTRTVFSYRKNEGTEKIWGVALDIGYSAVKGFSQNSVYCFPSYATKLTSSQLNLGKANADELQYRDEKGDIWIVGAEAQEMMSANDSKDSMASLYGRNRYFSPMFKVIARVGMALGMTKNNYGDPHGKTLVVQTGLPPAYLKSDTPLLKEALAGKHEFDIKIGNSNWQHFVFEIPEANIRVMAQPMGTLLSISTDINGRFINEANDYFKSNMIILDPGFGTLDVFCIRNKTIDSYETFDDLGMKRVLSETADKIFEKYGVEISVPAMQKYLETGKVKKFIRKERRTELINFDDILEECNKKVCAEALEKLDTIYDNMLEQDYLVITGGTGAAWKDMITDYYAGMDGLKIIYGNQNDTLEDIFSNVRGYYMYLLGKLKALERKGTK